MVALVRVALEVGVKDGSEVEVVELREVVGTSEEVALREVLEAAKLEVRLDDEVVRVVSSSELVVRVAVRLLDVSASVEVLLEPLLFSSVVELASGTAEVDSLTARRTPKSTKELLVLPSSRSRGCTVALTPLARACVDPASARLTRESTTRRTMAITAASALPFLLQGVDGRGCAVGKEVKECGG